MSKRKERRKTAPPPLRQIAGPKAALGVMLAASIALLAHDARAADEPPASEAPPATEKKPVASTKAPPASKGFQMSYQAGLNFPFGNATTDAGDSLASRYNWQWDLFLIGLGVKFTENLYVGGYVDLTFGAKGNDPRVRSACRDRDSNLENDVTCGSYVMRAGLETRYSFTPASQADFWLGYGFGPVLAGQSIHDRVNARREATQVSGWEYTRLSGGVVFRPVKALGVGPYVSMALGQFNKTQTTLNNETVFEGKIENRALHVWGSLGLRVVLFP